MSFISYLLLISPLKVLHCLHQVLNSHSFGYVTGFNQHLYPLCHVFSRIKALFFLKKWINHYSSLETNCWRLIFLIYLRSSLCVPVLVFGNQPVLSNVIDIYLFCLNLSTCGCFVQVHWHMFILSNSVACFWIYLQISVLSESINNYILCPSLSPYVYSVQFC